MTITRMIGILDLREHLKFITKIKLAQRLFYFIQWYKQFRRTNLTIRQIRILFRVNQTEEK